MAVARGASAFLGEDDFRQALDGLADLVPARRAVQSLRPEQQLQAWVRYADQLEARLAHACGQLARLRMERAVDRVVCREPARDASAHPECADDAEAGALELLARLRAEQLMNLRLLGLLARGAALATLADPQGEAAALLDARRRGQLRARDFEESLAEHQALRQARRDALLREGESARAQQVPVPAAWEGRSRFPLRLVIDQDT
jgi:hypothetical protein